MQLKPGDYVNVNNRLDREIFLNLCEEQGITWSSGRKAKEFLPSLGNLIKDRDGSPMFLYIASHLHLRSDKLFLFISSLNAVVSEVAILNEIPFKEFKIYGD